MIRQRITSVFASLAVALAGVTLSVAPVEAEAKRLGSGRASGMQRQMPAKQADSSPPAQNATPNQAGKPAQAAPANAAAQTAAQPAKRSWMGPIAGLAAGLGLAALASHLGFGEGLANFMMIALLAMVAFVAIRFLMRRFAAPRPQLAGANGANFQVQQPAWNPPAGSAAAPMVTAAAAAPVSTVPADFDAAGFEKIAKQVFIRLQAANDAGDQADLRRFTTPQMYASIQHDLLERGSQPQRTEVLQLDASVVDVATENGERIVSVRFWGLVREASERAAEDFDEIWHLARSGDGWLIAGIQQAA